MPPRKSTSSLSTILLTKMAEVKDITVPLNADGTIGISSIQNILKKKEPPQVIGSYKYKSQTLFLIGYISGKAGTENKHELPPPHDTILPFGDIIVLSSKDQNSWTNPVPFKMSDYESFYTRAFGGFDDLDSEEEGEEEVVEDANEIVDEVVEEEEGEEPEDDEGGDEVAAECNDDMEGDAELVSTRVVSKKKKRTGTVNMVMGGAAQIYASYLHVPEKDEILVESFELPYEERNITTQRRRVLNILKGLFEGKLNTDETRQLERCIYNGSIRAAGQRHVGKAWSHNPFVEMYQMIAKHIAANFNPDAYVNNTELYARYKAGEITFKDISEMDTYQLFEERWKDSFAQQKVREKRQLEGDKSMATDRFLCGKCGKRECTYYELQTRSADEPMTIFITCLNCGKHWRQ
jgi:DNA-directed RNA polymerase subunit M/transcription elongation factor TFIIS